MGSGMEKPLPVGKTGDWMMDLNTPSLQILHLQPGVWQKPFGVAGGLGEKKGLLAKVDDRGGSFLLAEMSDSLGKMMDDTGQLPMTWQNLSMILLKFGRAGWSLVTKATLKELSGFFTLNARDLLLQIYIYSINVNLLDCEIIPTADAEDESEATKNYCMSGHFRTL